MNIPPYPLCWPDNQPRCKSRAASQFRTELPKALKNVSDSLRLFAHDSGKALQFMQITSNVGLAGGNPADPGIAVWFQWDGAMRCIAVDRYAKVAENLQAIHHVMEARRVELRHAGIEMVRTTFRGFTALPPPPDQKPWHELLGIAATASAEEIDAAYKAKARLLATENRQADLQDLNVARDRARSQFK